MEDNVQEVASWIFIEKIKKLVLIGGSILLIIFTVFYFSVFFQQGMIYQETFLQQTKSDDMGVTQFEGKVHGQHLKVSREENKESITVTFQSIDDQLIYTVLATLLQQGEYRVKVQEANGAVLLEGIYRENSMYLEDLNGEMIIDILIIPSYTYHEKQDITPNKWQIIETALGANEKRRGEGIVLLLVAILAIVLIIDIKFPLFDFHLRHMWDVVDPEPSDWYYVKQSIVRIILVMGMLGLLFIAIIN